ncbi:MAG: hypothetical protein ABW042_06360, partial [Phenylobacterium sp.]
MIQAFASGEAVSHRQLLRAAEAASYLLLAGFAAYGGWTAVRPLPAPTVKAAGRAAAPVDLGVLSRFDPFYRAGGAGAGEAIGPAAEGGGGPKLYGVRYGGGKGAAILSVGGGPQKVFDVGQSVAPGLVLAE